MCAYTTEKRFKTFKFEFLVLFLQASEADVPLLPKFAALRRLRVASAKFKTVS